MSDRERSRREFLVKSLSGVGAAWAVANYAGIEEAYAFVQQSAQYRSAGQFGVLHGRASRRGGRDGGADHPDRLDARRARSARHRASSTAS